MCRVPITRSCASIPGPGEGAVPSAAASAPASPPLALEDSESLLDELWAQATRDWLAWTQKWQVGDLIIWDNRCTMHRRDGFAGHGRRRMHRLMTRGERPV